MFDVVFGNRKWNELTGAERELFWNDRVEQEQLGNVNPVIIGLDDPTLMANLPDPLHGVPNVLLFNTVYGHQAWQDASPYRRYTLWAERVQLERDGKVEKIITEAELRHRAAQEAHDARLPTLLPKRRRAF
jgi:hypothetical protein